MLERSSKDHGTIARNTSSPPRDGKYSILKSFGRNIRFIKPFPSSRLGIIVATLGKFYYNSIQLYSSRRRRLRRLRDRERD